jgi:uncharacterized membrane protein
MDRNKKIVVGVIALVAFLFVAFSIGGLFVAASDASICVAAGTDLCPHKQQIDFLAGTLPVIASIAVIAGALVYYLMAGRVESSEKNLKKNSEVLLRFLSPEEKKLVGALIDNKGKVLQAEITRLPGMSKLKSHRVVQKLLDKGVIEKDSVGKTNVVRFTKEIKEGLL